MAHAPLLRANTAPLFPSIASPASGARAQTPMNAAGAPRSRQMSTTGFNSTTSLASLASTATLTNPPSNGQVVATSNIINQKADASRSLYQICVALKQRLAQVPNFEVHLQQLEQLEIEEGGDGDPVEALWQMFRAGYPLLTIYNALQPREQLVMDDKNANDLKKSKISIFKFIKACMSDLNIPAAECFVVGDVMGTDTTGFVKVTTVVNHVLDLAQERGLLLQAQSYPEDDLSVQPGSKRSYRDYIVQELVDTERKYVQDLENLYDLKKTLEQRVILNGDVIHQIFLNINAILDFQRRFLIRVETTNSMPRHAQQWGALFVAFKEAFDIYQPFIANQRKAALLAQSVFDKIRSAEHPVAVDFNTLGGFLLKPMQRLVKYPLLLKDLMKKTEYDEEKPDLEAGVIAAESVLSKANEAVDRDLLDEALDDLINRVDDWKNHRVDHFGKLLLHGVYTVVTGKSDQEKDYEIYLFESILLCCKEITPNKTKDKKDKTKSTGPKIRNKNARLQLKGRIFMTNVTEVISLGKPGSYTVQIWWKGDPGVENFIIKFQNEESMKRWDAGLCAQRKLNTPRQEQSSPDSSAAFAWMQQQGQAGNTNPYKDEEGDDDDDDFDGNTLNTASLRQSRNTSTDGPLSIANLMQQQPPPRYPVPAPPGPPGPLSLQTQMLPQGSAVSPGTQGGESYFSPTSDSPVTSRGSMASGIFQPPAGYVWKTGTPQPWEDGSNRYTAPAMPRSHSREGPSPSNAYGMVNGGRNPRGTSMSQMSQNDRRLRSNSTPDINGHPNGRRTPGGSQGNIPAVPGIPPHLHPTHERHDSTLPRSNTGSPRNDLPIRSNTQSPGMQRQRLEQQNGSYGGATMAQFPTQPIYPRQTTPGPQYGGENTSRHGAGVGSSLSMSSESTVPSQLKVKVNYNVSNYITLVVAFNISYQSLVDRIDAKLARSTNSSIGRGNLRLRYRDDDGDFVSIQSDDDIQIAFIEWYEGLRKSVDSDQSALGGVGEIELFCVGE